MDEEDQVQIQDLGPGGGIAAPAAQRDDALRRSARAFEAAFLAEMLRAAGAGQPADSFGGGIGEEQFASFLIDHQAEQFAARGGIGLAEIILRSVLSQSDKTP